MIEYSQIQEHKSFKWNRVFIAGLSLKIPGVLGDCWDSVERIIWSSSSIVSVLGAIDDLLEPKE